MIHKMELILVDI